MVLSTDDQLYTRFFSDQTHAPHIVFSYALMRAVEAAKFNLRKKPADQRTQDDKALIEFFSGRGSLFVLASAVASCLELVTAKSIPNLFRLSFGPNVSPTQAQSYWAPLVEAMLPFCSQLQPAVNNVLRDKDIVADSIKNFRASLTSIKKFHAPTFAEFSTHVVISS